MATNNKIWIALAVVTILFAAGYYYYDTNASTAEAQQVEQVQGEIQLTKLIDVLVENATSPKIHRLKSPQVRSD